MEFQINSLKSNRLRIYKFDSENPNYKGLPLYSGPCLCYNCLSRRSNITIMGLALLILVALASNCPSAEVALNPARAAGDANMPVASSPLYIGEITGDDVNIRSGPGTDHYNCGRLYKGDRVKVFGSQSGWTRIVPPAGSFSWIAMPYISINLEDPSKGIVSGNSVAVYAGSDFLEPLRSTREQVTLKRGNMVKLLGEEKDDYYKIVPPEGASLWISSQYVKSVAAVEQITPAAPTDTSPEEKPVVEANEPAKAVTAESEKIEEYHSLQKLIETERAKPINEQDYSNIKKALQEIAGNKQAGMSARYAEAGLKLIERYELALMVADKLRLQSENLQDIEQQIQQAHDKKLVELKSLGRFATIGWLQSSVIYQSDAKKYYRIVDDSDQNGKFICYAMPGNSLSQTNLSKFIGRKVGLVGTIESHPPTALVRFTEIVELSSP